MMTGLFSHQQAPVWALIGVLFDRGVAGVRRAMAGLICVGCVASFMLGCQRNSQSTSQIKVDPSTVVSPTLNSTKRAKRIVSLTLLSDEILWQLGSLARQHVVAVSTLADHVDYSSVQGLWPQKIPRIDTRAEPLLLLLPDLVILASYTSPELREILAKANINTLLLDDGTGIDAYLQNINNISLAINKGEGEQAQQGKKLVDTFNQRLNALKREAVLHDHGRVVISWVDGMVAGEGTTFDEMVQLVGGQNGAVLLGVSGHKPLRAEVLLTMSPPPDVVIPCPGSCGLLDKKKAVKRFCTQPAFALYGGCVEGRIYPIPKAVLFSTGSTLIDLATAIMVREQR